MTKENSDTCAIIFFMFIELVLLLLSYLIWPYLIMVAAFIFGAYTMTAKKDADLYLQRELDQLSYDDRVAEEPLMVFIAGILLLVVLVLALLLDVRPAGYAGGIYSWPFLAILGFLGGFLSMWRWGKARSVWFKEKIEREAEKH